MALAHTSPEAERYEIRQGDGHIVVRLADGEARSMQLRVSQRTIQRGERVAVAGPEGGKRRRQIEAVLGQLSGGKHLRFVAVGRYFGIRVHSC